MASKPYYHNVRKGKLNNILVRNEDFETGSDAKNHAIYRDVFLQLHLQ